MLEWHYLGWKEVSWVCEGKCEQRKGPAKVVWVQPHSFAQGKKRSERWFTGSVCFYCTGTLSPTHSVPLGGEELWFAVFQTPLLPHLPDVASRHCQDLGTHRPVPKQVCWGAERKRPPPSDGLHAFLGKLFNFEFYFTWNKLCTLLIPQVGWWDACHRKP